MEEFTTEFEADVLVLGAGMAGLTAARALLERGMRVTVLEARDSVGGRVFSIGTSEGVVVEQGAEFVHGHPPELWALLDECGAKTFERDGTMLRERPDGGLAEDDPEDGDVFSALDQLEEFTGEDIPFAGWLEHSDIPEEERAAILGYVEGFNAADARRIGVRALGVQQKAEDEAGGRQSADVRGGYAQLPEYLARRVKELGGAVRLNTRVEAVHWSEGRVQVETTAGVFRAGKCIVTLPLGVLQQVNGPGGMRFEPEPQALAPARRLAMGHVVRFTMMFRERWWEKSNALDKSKLQAMSFLFTSRRMPPVWWTRHPEPEAMPTLTGWVGGPRAQALAGKSAAELGREACAALAEVFAIEEDLVRASLLATYTHDWSGDPNFWGAYSYVPAGELDAPEAMTQPEADTLFFAGEHTDVTGHWGTVHAAMRSGVRAAEQISSDTTGTPVVLDPVFVERVWGEQKLSPWYPQPVPGKPIGEVWLTAENCVAEGTNATLAELARNAPAAFGNEAGEGFPLLIKLLYPREKLSVQVHPDDAQARATLNQPRGKTECWYVLSAEPGAQVAVGFREPLTAAEIRTAIEDGSIEARLNYIPVKAGDLVFVDAGTVHAIGPGMVVLETQQYSDVTYRLWDYGRPRELHLHAGLAVARTDTAAGLVSPNEMEGFARLVSCPYFTVDRFRLEPEAAAALGRTGEMQILIALGDGASVRGEGASTGLPPGQAVVLPAAQVEYQLETTDAVEVVRVLR